MQRFLILLIVIVSLTSIAFGQSVVDNFGKAPVDEYPPMPPTGWIESACEKTSAPVDYDTNEIIVFVKELAPLSDLLNEYQLSYLMTLKSDEWAYVLKSNSVESANASIDLLRNDHRVRAAYNNRRVFKQKFGFTSNDTYFNPYQWHLVNNLGTGIDVRAQGAWDRDATGTGVVTAIVDDGLQRTHSDISANYNASDSWDFGNNDSDPSPYYSDDDHGTAVGGVMAARGGNGIGVTGIAPYAQISCMRVDYYYGTTQMFADATLYHSSESNRNVKIKNHSYGAFSPYIASPLEADSAVNSASAGTIHCFAAGNERGTTSQDSNTYEPQNNPAVINVAALGSNGVYTSYSCFGANVFCTTPSSQSGEYAITTTDRTGSYGYASGDYCFDFGGTSSSSPLAAGIMAIGKQLQSALNVRFAKHIITKSCDKVHSADSSYSSDNGWRANSSGLEFNQNYGFGLLNANKFTQNVVKYTGVTTLVTESKNATVNLSIPDNNQSGVSTTFNISSAAPLEDITVKLVISHNRRGQLEAFLKSPTSAAWRRLLSSNSDSNSGINWTFTTNAFWGENPQGTWTLMVRDVVAGTTGTFNSYSATFRMGQLIEKTTLVADNKTATLGDTINLTATLTSDVTGQGVPNQLVYFMVDSNSVGSGTTNSNGIATVSYYVPPGNGVGNKTIYATYNGDSTHYMSFAQALLVVNAPPTIVNGNVNLEGWNAGLSGLPITIEIRNIGSPNPLETHNVTLNSNGGYSFSTTLTGVYDFSAKGSKWLRRTIYGQTITSPMIVNYFLLAGDTDNNNAVTLIDLNNAAGDLGFAPSGTRGETDLNGNSITDDFDLMLIAGNLGLLGDL